MAASAPGPQTGPGALLSHLVHDDLPYKVAKRRWLEIFEQEYIMELLRRHDNNISQAAQTAGIDRKSIQRILKKNDLQVSRE